MNEALSSGGALAAPPVGLPWQTILASAADLIEERGLVSGHFIDHQGRLCARGAIYLAACGQAEPRLIVGTTNVRAADEATMMLSKYLITVLDQNPWTDSHDANTVAYWSNNQTSKEAVIAAMRACIVHHAH